MKPSEEVAQALKDAGLQCHPAPDVPEQDWKVWLLHFKPPVSYGRCPECGEPMVRRKGKYGVFAGCAGFPFCKHTENI